jgi:hypothetical protein
MKENETPLSKLFIEEGKLDEQLLTQLLESYVKIIRSTGELLFEEQYWKLNQSGKIAVIILAQKALARLGKTETDKIKPKEISNKYGIPGGTVWPTLRVLEKQGLLKSEKGEYFVPNHALLKFKEFLKKEEKWK